MSEYVTARSAAALILRRDGQPGVHESWVRHLLRQGRIKGAKLHDTPWGQAWRIPLGSDGRPVVEPAKKGKRHESIDDESV